MITDFRQRILDGEPIEEVSLEAVQVYTNTILDGLNPIPKADYAFIVVALRAIEKTLLEHDPRDAPIAVAIGSIIGMTTECKITIPADTSEDIVNEIYRSMKRV